MIAWLTLINDALVALMDFVLGWTAYLPMDVRLLILAIGTSAILTFVRLFTTNQNLLARCRDDKRTLKGLIRQAKRDGDKKAVGRHRSTIGLIGIQSMKAELKPLVVSLLPIVCLACWAAARLNYLPPTPGEPVEVKAYLTTMAIGEMVHMVPADGLEVQEGWIRRVAPDVDAEGNVANGVAAWTLRGPRSDQPYRLLFRHGGQTVEHELVLDGRRAPAALIPHGDQGVVLTEVILEPYKFLGVVPGYPRWALPPWLAAYLLIAVPFVMILKRLTGIC